MPNHLFKKKFYMIFEGGIGWGGVVWGRGLNEYGLLFSYYSFETD